MTKKEINSLVLNEAKYSVELVEIGRLLWSSVVLVVCVFCELNWEENGWFCEGGEVVMLLALGVLWMYLCKLKMFALESLVQAGSKYLEVGATGTDLNIEWFVVDVFETGIRL